MEDSKEKSTVKEKKVLEIASVGKRIGAALIDKCIPWVAIGLMTITAAVPLSFAGGYASGVFDFIFALLMVAVIIGYVGLQLYYFSKGQSIGKAILGMKVVSGKDGEPLTFGWMILREFIVKKASEVVFCLGYIWILIDKEKRGWHDLIMDDYVVDMKDEIDAERRAAKEARKVEYVAPVKTVETVDVEIKEKESK